MSRKKKGAAGPLERFHAPTRAWFEGAFGAPTGAQEKGWPPILDGKSTLLLAPTGSGKTLAAFLVAIDSLVFSEEPSKGERCRLLYVSPLKALAVDVERNLRAPLAGITQAAERLGAPYRVPSVAVRSGDTAPDERARLAKKPPDILITTPESLYLLLTSNAREGLRSVDMVIIDEIHALAATKRGAHMFLSLERLEALREGRPKLVRIGLSATQRPLEEVARLLGGGEVDSDGRWAERPVAIVDASAPKALDLRIEVPVEDMSRLGEPGRAEPKLGDGKGEDAATSRSIWPSIHPRVVELVRAHRSTMIFTNSRRLAERLAAALNETAGEAIALAHHGSLAREQRAQIEDRLKSGTLPAIVATSSLELGIDVGAVDLVVQIESPPSVAAGLQRVGRAGHSVGETSRGVMFPKHRGDLLACAAASARMAEGKVEETRYPKNPLDVLAQQIVAIAAMDVVHIDALYALVRRAAPFAELPRGSFEGVLDMLSGRYPSDEFAELRPRLVWDRTTGAIRAREGARRLAVVNAGTIPDRGLFGVFLPADDGGKTGGRRVGELDEEMVFEARAGEVFLLGASSWRITEITHDRVIVVPAPGEPGKMPFWRGDRAGRSLELGEAIGALTRALAKADDAAAEALLCEHHRLDARAARNLVRYVREQAEVTGEVPSDRTIVIERFVDEVGDYRVCVLSPFGGRVHAPLAQAIAERCRSELALELETVWTDDGIVLRFPEAESPPDVAALLPQADEVEDLVVRSLGGTSIFATHFRECAGRALLLPRRHPGKRSPLWAQRKRASDLLAVASRYGSFPMLLETYREVMRDVFDLPALADLLRRVTARKLRVTTVDTRAPSPFAASLLYAYAGNFVYEGDLPLAERKAQVLAVDQGRLRELLGEAELRELLDADAVRSIEAQLQRLDSKRPLAHGDQAHDLLLSLGDLSRDELFARAGLGDGADARGKVNGFVDELLRQRRIIEVRVGGEARVAAAEDAGRLRDALGVVPPPGMPAAFLEPPADPLGDLVSRYARTHGPFRAEDVARRFGLGIGPVRAALASLADRNRVTEGEFLPGGSGREHCDVEVLRAIKRRSLAKLRAEVEPVTGEAYARFLADWHSLPRRRRGAEALLSAVEQLQGAPLPASALETEILPARVEGYRVGDIDRLCAAGEVVWRGIEPLGERSGRIALYLSEGYRYLAAPSGEAEGALAGKVRAALARRGAVFFLDLLQETGAFGHDLARALWDMVWAGELTNDTLAPLRALGREDDKRGGRRRDLHRPSGFGARRAAPPGTEGRWSLLPALSPSGGARGEASAPDETARRAALAQVLLERHGILTREGALAEGIAGGFSAVYDVLKAMEEAGRLRRGYFVAGLGAAQFALPGAEDRLRFFRDASDERRTFVLSAADPASPWGAALPWPTEEGAGDGAARAGSAGPKREAGARVILHDGRLVGWMSRSERSLRMFLPGAEPERSAALRAIAAGLSGLTEEGRARAVLLATVDGQPTHASPLARALVEEGFQSTAHGYLKRVGMPSAARRAAALPGVAAGDRGRYQPYPLRGWPPPPGSGGEGTEGPRGSEAPPGEAEDPDELQAEIEAELADELGE